MLSQYAHETLEQYRKFNGRLTALPCQSPHVGDVVVHLSSDPFSNRTVNWKGKKCSCFFWQDHGMICEHAYCVAVQFHLTRDYGSFLNHAFDKSYHAATWISAFSNDRQLSLPDLDNLVTTDEALRYPPTSAGSKRSKKRSRYKGYNDSSLQKKRASKDKYDGK